VLTLVIVNDQNKSPKGTLDRCLKSIDYPCEIIIVEGSKKKHKHKTLKQVQPFNYNACLNSGIQAAKTPYIALCNNDIEFSKGAIAKIITTMQERGILSASPCGSESETAAIGYGIGQELKGWCIFINREVINRCGMLPTKYEFWGADNAYADLLMLNKIHHHRIGGAVVHHFGSETLQTLPESEQAAKTTDIMKRYDRDRMAELARYEWRLKKGVKAKTVVMYNPKEVIDLHNMTKTQALKLVTTPAYCHLLEPVNGWLDEDLPEPNIGQTELNYYCISLKRATDRRATVEQEFKREGVPVVYVDAIDAQELQESAQPKGYKACLLSHAKAIEQAEGRYAVIFEDDVELCDGFIQKLNKVVSELPANFLFAQLNGLVVMTLNQHESWQRVMEAYGAFAYVVNLDYRAEILRQLYAHQETTNLDEVYVKMQPHYLCYLLIAEPLAFHAKGFSYRQDDFPRQGVYKTVERK
jgi:GR25 family glycosyltransferase involved in LPS biosynthesis/glycosyltransferase involved in cell wall biosynthesis